MTKWTLEREYGDYGPLIWTRVLIPGTQVFLSRLSYGYNGHDARSPPYYAWRVGGALLFELGWHHVKTERDGFPSVYFYM